MKRPSQRRLNQIAGALFLLSAAMSFARDDVAFGAVYVAIAVLFVVASQNDS